MLRLLVPGDEPPIEVFLEHHAASSMFLRSNLRAAGIVDHGQRFQGSWFGHSKRPVGASRAILKGGCWCRRRAT